MALTADPTPAGSSGSIGQLIGLALMILASSVGILASARQLGGWKERLREQRALVGIGLVATGAVTLLVMLGSAFGSQIDGFTTTQAVLGGVGLGTFVAGGLTLISPVGGQSYRFAAFRRRLEAIRGALADPGDLDRRLADLLALRGEVATVRGDHHERAELLEQIDLVTRVVREPVARPAFGRPAPDGGP
jgi:hypothetical protein